MAVNWHTLIKLFLIIIFFLIYIIQLFRNLTKHRLFSSI